MWYVAPKGKEDDFVADVKEKKRRFTTKSVKLQGASRRTREPLLLGRMCAEGRASLTDTLVICDGQIEELARVTSVTRGDGRRRN